MRRYCVEPYAGCAKSFLTAGMESSVHCCAVSITELFQPAVLLVTLFLALTALQFVVSTNLPNSRCAAWPPALKTPASAHTGPAVSVLCIRLHRQ